MIREKNDICIANQFHKVYQYGGSRETLVSDLRQHSMEPVAELVEQRHGVIEAEQRGLSVTA